MCEDFIRIYDDAFDYDYCQSLIKLFEFQSKHSRSWGREESSHIRHDESSSLNDAVLESYEFSTDNARGYLNKFNEVFWDKAYTDYATQFSVLNDCDKHSIFSYKLQKTKPAEGYHIWHHEHGNHYASKRIGVYILYLNDVEMGGETEFLYQRTRVEAKTGRLVIFPAAFTHVHRGNPPLSGNKYIMTGWIEYA